VSSNQISQLQNWSQVIILELITHRKLLSQGRAKYLSYLTPKLESNDYCGTEFSHTIFKLLQYAVIKYSIIIT